MRRRLFAAAAMLVAAAVVLSAWIWWPQEDTTSTAAAKGSAAVSDPVLYYVDHAGAIVGTAEGIAGIARDGREVWTLSSDTFSPMHAVCTPRCPAAVVSSDANGVNSPIAPDPAPKLLGGAHLPADMTEAPQGKASVVAVAPGSVVRLESDDDGKAQWLVHGKDGAVRSTTAAGAVVDWFETSSHDAAMAIVSGGSVVDQQPWALRGGVWQPVGPSRQWTAGFGCISKSGRFWVNDEAGIRSSNQPPTPLLSKVRISNCAFTKDNLIVASYSDAPAGPTTTITVFALDGTEVSRHRFPDREVRMAADAGSDRYVLFGDHKAVVHQGGRQRTIPDVAGARFDERGDLVTVDPDGNLRWE